MNMVQIAAHMLAARENICKAIQKMVVDQTGVMESMEDVREYYDSLNVEERNLEVQTLKSQGFLN